MKRFLVSLGLVLWLGAFNGVDAHPGHGSGGGGSTAEQVLHHVSEPIHVLPMLVIVATSGLVVLRFTFGRSRPVQPTAGH